MCAHQDLIHKSFLFKFKHIIDSAGQAPDDPQLLLTGANSDLWPLVLHQSAQTHHPQIEASISASIRRLFYEICFTCEGTWSSLLLFHNHFVPLLQLFSRNKMNTVAYFSSSRPPSVCLLLVAEAVLSLMMTSSPGRPIWGLLPVCSACLNPFCFHSKRAGPGAPRLPAELNESSHLYTHVKATTSCDSSIVSSFQPV